MEINNSMNVFFKNNQLNEENYEENLIKYQENLNKLNLIKTGGNGKRWRTTTVINDFIRNIVINICYYSSSWFK